MKKYGICLVTILTICLASGCGETKEENNKNTNTTSNKETILACTQETDSKTSVDFNVLFKGNEVKKMDMKLLMDLSSYNDTTIKAIGKQDYCEVMKNSSEKFKEALKNCSQNIENKELIVTADIDVSTYIEDETDKYDDIESTKNEIEKTGFKCTIK